MKPDAPTSESGVGAIPNVPGGERMSVEAEPLAPTPELMEIYRVSRGGRISPDPQVERGFLRAERNSVANRTEKALAFRVDEMQISQQPMCQKLSELSTQQHYTVAHANQLVNQLGKSLSCIQERQGTMQSHDNVVAGELPTAKEEWMDAMRTIDEQTVGSQRELNQSIYGW